MATSEIEKLERRYAENPHGLTFAPLAEVHRKNGDITRALELLTAGLELHPNYIPASIVLGRCHQDRNDLAAAEAAFAHVLRLDDENVIALKSLADISERQERYTEAESWLRRLVTVDRSNEDAREQLARVQAAKASGTAPPDAAPAPVEPKVETPAPAPVLEMIDLAAEPELNQSVPEGATEEASTEQGKQDRLPEPEPSEPEFKPETEPATVAEARSEQPDVPLPFIETAQEQVAEAPEQVAEPTMEVADAVPPAPEPIAAAAESKPAPEPPPSPSEEEVQPLAGLISAEFQPPLEAIGGLGVETSDEVLLEVSGSSEFSVPDASEDLKSVAARLVEPKPAASKELSAPGEDVPEPVEAAAAPMEDTPPPVPTAPVAAVELPESQPVEPEWISPEPPKRQYLARETNGQSVGAFFRALLSARLTPSNGDVAASSGRNGGSAFDYEEEALPVPPAVPAPEQSADAAVSFDDFFGSEPSGSGPSRAGKSDPGKDDLDQFQSWLQNLKR